MHSADQLDLKTGPNKSARMLDGSAAFDTIARIFPGTITMIYVRLAGGLGNQLFQLSAAMQLSLKSGLPIAPLAGALGRYEKSRTPDSLRLLESPKLLGDVGFRPSRFTDWLASRARIGRWPVACSINDNNFWRKATGTLGAPRVLFVDGYFQTGWNDARVQASVRQFHLKSTEACVLSDPATCVIHIRGGDFLTLTTHQVVDHRFYARAVNHAKMMGFKRFTILTDDPKYAASIEAKIRAEHTDIETRLLQPSPDPLTDFRIMLRANARIIGNSTFSWWAAALDPKRAPTWAPDQFVRGVLRDSVLGHERLLTT